MAVVVASGNVEVGGSAPQLTIHGSTVGRCVTGMGVHVDPAGNVACGRSVVMAGSGTAAAVMAGSCGPAGAGGAVDVAAGGCSVVGSAVGGTAHVGSTAGPAGAVRHMA